MRPVSAPAVDTGGTSSASVELPPPLDLNALTGSAGPLGMGRRRRSTGGRRGQRRWGADAGTDVDELDRLAGSLDRHADSLQPAEDFDVAVLPYDVRLDRDLLRAFAAEADTPRGGHSSRRTLDPKPAAVVVGLAAIAAIAQAELERAGPHPPAGPAVPDASRRGCRRRSNPHVPVIFGGPG